VLWLRLSTALLEGRPIPKLRNAETDLGKMAQYLARKCVIHSPQAELDLSATDLEKSPRFGTDAPHFKGAQVYMLTRGGEGAEEPCEFLAISPKGRAMKVTVEEVNPEDFDEEGFAEVGE